MADKTDRQVWTRGHGACPHSSDEVCGPCQRAIDMRRETTGDRLTPLSEN